MTRLRRKSAALNLVRIIPVWHHGGERPEGLCDGAWQAMEPFVRSLAAGGGKFYGDWMRDPFSAMVSCNDGFRPVSFYIEVID